MKVLVRRYVILDLRCETRRTAVISYLISHISYLFFIFWLLPPVSYSQGVWTAKANFPSSGRLLPFCFSIADKGYVSCGDTGLIFARDLWQYNAALDVWTQKADFGGGGRSRGINFSIDSYGYAGSGYGMGYTYTQDFWQYDPVGNTWSRKADMPFAIIKAACFVVESRAYVATGQNSAGLTQNLWEYNPSTDAWVQKTSFPGSARSGASAFAIGDKGYVGLGASSVCLNDFWQYDALADSWTQKASFAGVSRYDAAAFTIDCKGYIGTGDSSQGLNFAFFNDLWEYDTTANQWNIMSNMPAAPRYETAFFSIGTKGYIGLGGTTGFYYDFYEYTPGMLCTSLGEGTVDNGQLTIYPNPATDQLTIRNQCAISSWQFANCQLPTANFFYQVSIHNVIGALVYSASVNSKEVTINCSQWPRGIYLLKIVTEQGELNKKIVISY